MKSARKRAARSGPTKTHESGSVLVEASLAILAMAIFALGIAEYGNVFGSALNVSSAVRNGARTGAATTDQPVTDDAIIQSVIGENSAMAGQIDRIVIYDAASSPNGPPSPCMQSPHPGAGSNCNVYMPGDFSKSASQLATTTDQNWPASARQPGVDIVGVWVQAKRQPITGIVWSPNSLNDHFAMMIEPATKSSTTGDASGFIDNTTTFASTWNDDWMCWGAYSTGPQCGWGHSGGHPSGGGGST